VRKLVEIEKMALRARRGKRGREDVVELDCEKTAAENVLEVLVNICRRSGGVGDNRKVGYLQALVGLLQKIASKDTNTDLGLRVKEIMLCLRIPLTSSSGEVRAGTLRVLRYFIRSKQDVVAVTSVNMHLLIARTLDLDLDNKPERIQAVKLARKLLIFGPGSFPSSLVKCLMAIVQRGGKEKSRDVLWRISLAVLCELSCLNPDLFLTAGCVKILSASLLECGGMSRVGEAVIGCLLRLYSIPSLRCRSGLDLSLIVAPFTEQHYTHSAASKGEEGRTECAAAALLSILRSWPGLIHLSNPEMLTKPLKTLVDTLYLPSYDTRRTILDLLYQSLSLQVPDWTDEFEVAMRTADPSAPKDSWKLTDGFVAAEGNDVLPHLAKSRPNLVESHMAVLLSCYINLNLPSALITVIVTSDTVLSVRAAVLLGQLLHLVSKLLPHEIAATQNCLPLLANHIDTADPEFSKLHSTRAVAAVTALRKLHALKRRGCLPHSLLLEQVLEYSGHSQGCRFVSDKLKLSSSCSVNDQNTEINSIKDSGVVTQRDPQAWKWELIMSSLKWPSEALRRLEDSTCKLFLKKVTDFYLPTSNMFSRMELDSSRTRYVARVGQALLDFLLSSVPVGVTQTQDPEANQRIDSLLEDIMSCIDEVIQSSSPHDCVFSPTRLMNTACQLYFLFLGRLSRTETGRTCLDRHRTLSLLTELLKVRHDVYLKLVISSMDYRQDDWGARSHLLTKALTAAPEIGRMYATKWLGVLARVGVPSISVYGVELLVKQLKDESLMVASTALTILDEVCDDKMFLESLVSNSSVLLGSTGRAALELLGDRARLLLARCVSSATGFNLMNSNGWLNSEMAYWAKSFNSKYVLLIDMLINDGFSLHQRSEDGHGTYGRRTGDAHCIRDVFVPPHLYGQLAQTRSGLELLLGESSFWSMVARVQELEGGTDIDSRTEEVWLEAKASIWGVAHVATNPTASLLLEQRGVIASLISIAENCPVLSVKGTAYYAMGLVATTRPGATALGGKGWVTLRHGRGDYWPIATDWLGATDTMFPSSPQHMVPSPAQSESWIGETSEELEPILRGATIDSKRGNRKETDRESEPGNARTLSGRKFSDKVSSWFRNSLDNGKTDNGNGKGVKPGRRNSEGSKGFASKLRNSIREKRSRTRTVSAGSLPPSKDDTPSGSCNDNSDIEFLDNKLRRKLSFSADEPDGDNERPIQASPGDILPGEMFQLDNIVEEPEKSENLYNKEKSSQCISTSSSGLSSNSRKLNQEIGQNRIASKSEHFSSDFVTSHAINISGQSATSEAVTPSGQSVGSCRSVPQLEPVDQSIVSIDYDGSLEEPPPPSLADIPSEGFQGEGVLLGVIRQGTSVSSVSSIGSYTFQENPGYSSRHSRRRPQLSESEDGDPIVGSRPGLSRQDSYSRNTFPIRGRHKPHPVLDAGRSVSVPPKIYATLPRSDNSKEPSYWGLAYPLSHMVLYPTDPALTACNVSSLPGAIGSLFQSGQTHHPNHCLGCFKLQVSARPRAASLTSANSNKIAVNSTSSLPGSHQSPATYRRSWVEPQTETNPIYQRFDHGYESPTGYMDAVIEAIDLICTMNNSAKAKQAETNLVKLQRKWPAIFTDICVYSDVSNMLGVFNFRLGSRKFIQELFLDVQFSKMDDEAMHVLGLGNL